MDEALVLKNRLKEARSEQGLSQALKSATQTPLNMGRLWGLALLS